MQSGNAAPDAPVQLAQDRGSHPIWAAGLTGAGQIVGAGDSGIGGPINALVPCCGLLISLDHPAMLPCAAL